MKHIREMLYRKYVLIYLLESLVFSITGIVDTVAVGRFSGENGLAALKLSLPVFAIMSLAGNVFATGLSVSLSNLIARGKKERANQTFLWVLISIAGVSVFLLLISRVFSEPLVSLFSGNTQDPVIKQMVRGYIMPFFGFSLPVIAYDVLSTVVALEGDEIRIRLSVYAVLITDVIGDYLAVRLELGIFGIAIASILAYTCSCLILCMHFVKGETCFYPERLRYEKRRLKEVLKAGNPDGLRGLCMFFAPMIVNRIMMFYGGTTGLAALSVQDAVHYLPEALCDGISAAVLLFTCIFAAEQDREALSHERKIARKSIVILVTFTAAMMFVLAPVIISPFTKDRLLLDQAVLAFRWYLLGLPFLAANLAVISYMQGMGKTGTATCYVALYELVLPTLCAYILGRAAGPEGIYASYAVKEIVLFLFQILVIGIYRKKYPGWNYAENEWDEIQDELRMNLTTAEDVTDASAAVINMCKSHGINKRQGNHMALCLEEIGINSISHGFANKGEDYLEARFMLTKNHMVLRLFDNCETFNLTDQYELLKMDDKTSHIGLKLVFASADSVDYSHSLNMNNVVIRVARNNDNLKGNAE
ncbi:MAG: ATP-binding protein [Lachnospiraceae bacterium]|nr:ATP-binding protein [Lachnospiraceae bacterium]